MLTKKAHWTIVLEGDGVDDFSLVAMVQASNAKVKVVSASCNIYWNEEKEKPKSEKSKAST